MQQDNTTQSNIGASGTLGNMGGLAGMVTGGAKKAGGFFKGLFGGGGGAQVSMPAGFPSNPSFGASSLGGIGGILSAISGGIGSLLGFADGGIANFAGAGAGIHANPTLAAIAEKPGKKKLLCH